MDRNILILLGVIRAHQPLTVLREHGLEYFQIAELMQDCVRQGLVAEGDASVVLSEKGQQVFANAKLRAEDGAQNGWIAPAFDHRIPQTRIFDVYLPKPTWKAT